MVHQLASLGVVVVVARNLDNAGHVVVAVLIVSCRANALQQIVEVLISD